MAIETGKFDETTPPDTTLHAEAYNVGDINDRTDRLIIPGLGICLSKSAVHDLQRNAAKKLAPKEYRHEYYDGFISEEQLRAWVRALDKHRSMEEAKDAKDPNHAHEEFCYPGTDTVDPTKSPHSISKHKNNFDIDRSESSISIHVTSGSRYLNGSSVKHHHYVSIHLSTPDGRRYGEVALTFDQFAAALVSNMGTPCTWDQYWGADKNSVMLKEVVKQPDSIADRMEGRLKDRLDDIEKGFAAIDQKLSEKINAGKHMSKTHVAELQRDLNILRGHLIANRDFTVEQSREEVAGIVEQAAISVAFDHKLTPEQVIANAHMGTLLETLVKHKLRPALPAPDKPESANE